MAKISKIPIKGEHGFEEIIRKKTGLERSELRKIFRGEKPVTHPYRGLEKWEVEKLSKRVLDEAKALNFKVKPTFKSGEVYRSIVKGVEKEQHRTEKAEQQKLKKVEKQKQQRELGAQKLKETIAQRRAKGQGALRGIFKAVTSLFRKDQEPLRLGGIQDLDLPKTTLKTPSQAFGDQSIQLSPQSPLSQPPLDNQSIPKGKPQSQPSSPNIKPTPSFQTQPPLPSSPGSDQETSEEEPTTSKETDKTKIKEVEDLPID